MHRNTSDRRLLQLQDAAQSPHLSQRAPRRGWASPRSARCAGSRAGRCQRRRRPGRLSAPCGQGQAGDLPVPIGRAVADGPVRPQAVAREIPRTEPARFDSPRAAAHRHDLRASEASRRPFDVQVRPARPERRRMLSELLPHTAKVADDLASSTRCTPRPSITIRPSRSSKPAPSLPAGRASARGWLTGWGARTRICRRSSC